MIIEFNGKKSIKRFVGQITHMDGDDIHVKYVTKSRIVDFYVFPKKEDIDVAEECDVMRVLQEPLCNNREQYYFDI